MYCPKNGKAPYKRHLLRIILIIISVLFIGFVLFVWIFSTCCISSEPSPSKNIYANDQRLADPKLLYASMTSAGLCSNENEQGGCYGNKYLYTDGRLVKNSGFYNYDSKTKEDYKPIQIQISNTIVSQINKKITDSNIMSKDCPNGQIMDASWDYQLNFNGVKKAFHNVYGDCKKIFDEIDQLIGSGGG